LFTVSDTGEGIPGEYFDRIFEKFGQWKPASRAGKYPPGWGLPSARWPSKRTEAASGLRVCSGRGALFPSRYHCRSQPA